MGRYVKIYFYTDGKKESKELYAEGTSKAFEQQGIDILSLENGDSFYLDKDSNELHVKVFQTVVGVDNDEIEYHVAPATLTHYEFNK